ncbi:MAG: hypothetical protein ACRC46_00550 [Thermoguttaceae bacterium]
MCNRGGDVFTVRQYGGSSLRGTATLPPSFRFLFRCGAFDSERINPFPTQCLRDDAIYVQWRFCHSLTLRALIWALAYASRSDSLAYASRSDSGFLLSRE